MGIKIHGLMTAALAISMCACSGSDVLEQGARVENSEVSFNFFDSKVEAFFSPSRADDTPSEKWKSKFSRFDLAIFPSEDAKDQTVYRIPQLSSDEGFGSCSMRLPIGKYVMVAVASTIKDATPVDISSPQKATFPNNHVTDMAYCSMPIDVVSGSNQVNGTLQRSLTKFILTSTDDITLDVGRVDLKMTGPMSSSFNPSTGYSIQLAENETHTRSFELNSKNAKPRMVAYFFIPQDKVKMKLEVNVYNKKEELIKHLVFDSVTLQQNHVTTYSGPLYSASTNLDFTFDDKDFLPSDEDVTFGDTN